MNRKHLPKQPPDPIDDPELWKVDPGAALGVFHLGMPRQELLQIATQKKLDVETLAGGHAIYVLDMDARLFFRPDPPYPLNLIEVSHESVRFGTLKILWDRPHNVFASIPSAATLWFDDLAQINGGVPRSTRVPATTDDQLVNGGVLWMKDLGVGFGLTRGRITSLYLCDPADLPHSGHGEFTSAQRHLSERLQIESFKSSTATRPAAKMPAAELGVKAGLLLIAVSVIAFLARQAWVERSRWENATEVQAEVVSVWPPPPDPFPSKFRVAFRDQQGTDHRLEFADNDFFATPQLGDQVTLRYLPQSPQHALGPIKFRDVAFDHFIPYLLGTIGIYLALHVATGFVVARWF